MSNVPKLRFPEFSGEWEEKNLGNLVEIKSGISPSSYDLLDNGKYAFLKVEDLNNCDKYQIISREYSNDCKNIIPQKSIIFPKRGAAILLNKVRININEILMDSNLMAITPNKNIQTEFLYYKIIKDKLFKIADTSTIPQINNKHILPYKVFIPSIPEQEKIASFLSAVDKQIEQLTKKEALLQEYKKGLMQKIFSQKLRFKADDGSEFPEWEEKKLGDILDYIQPTKYLVESTEYNDSYQTPVLTAGKTFILGYTNETEGIFANNLPVIIFDDFTTANKFVDFPFKAKSSAMKILITKNKNNIKFIYEIMQTLKYEIGGHERHWISKFAFLNIFLPCLEEQTKIANFLLSIDKKIELISKELEGAKEFKKALLQQMFA